MIQSQLVTRILRKSTPVLIATVVAIGLLAGASRALAVTMTWTNGSALWTSTTAWTTNQATGIDPVNSTNITCGAGAVSNVTATCVGGNGIPGINDQARFTNNANITVTISTATTGSTVIVTNTAGTITFDASAGSLMVTGRFRVADGNATSTVIWAGGTLTAPAVAGGGVASLQIGTSGSNCVGTLFVTNGILYGGGSVSLGTDSGSVGKLVVSGPGSVFTNAVGQAPNVNFQFRLRSAGSQLIVTNGGKFVWNCITRATSNSLILVSDPGSFLYTTNVPAVTEDLSVGMNDGAGPGSLMIVSTGATVRSDGTLNIGRGGSGVGQFSAFNTGIVVGAGSRVIVGPGSSSSDLTHLIIGSGSIGGSHFNNLTVYDGGNLQCDGPFFSIPNSNPATNNSFNMGGVLAMSTGTAHVVRNNSGAQNSSIVVSNAVFTCTSMDIRGVGGNSLKVLNNGFLNVTRPAPLTTNFDNEVSVVAQGGMLTIDKGTLNAVSGTNGNLVTVGQSAGTITGNSLIITNGGSLLADAVRVFGTNNIVFASGTLSAGGMTIDSNANNDAEFVVGDGANPAFYDMASGGTGFHSFRTGGAPDLVVTNGAFLRGSGTLTGTIKVLGTIVPGGAGVAGSIYSSNSLTFGSSSVMDFDLGTSSDLVTVNSDLDLGNSTLNVGSLTGFGAGTYVLFTHTNTVVSGTLNVGILPSGFSATVSNDVDNIPPRTLLVVNAVVTDPYAAWSSHYGIGAGQGNADPDADGMSNTNEFLAGFNPTNNAAYVHVISVAKASTTNIVVTYLGASGDTGYTGAPSSRTNVLEATTGTSGNYATNNFAGIATNILSGGTGLGQITSFVDTNGASGATKYYRVRVLVP